MMDALENKSLKMGISKTTFLKKVVLCMYLISAGLNAMYEFGCMFGSLMKTLIK